MNKSKKPPIKDKEAKTPKPKTVKPPKVEVVVHVIDINHNAPSIHQALGVSVDDLNGTRANIITDCIGLKKSEALEYIVSQMNKNKDVFTLAAVELLLSTFK